MIYTYIFFFFQTICYFCFICVIISNLKEHTDRITVTMSGSVCVCVFLLMHLYLLYCVDKMLFNIKIQINASKKKERKRMDIANGFLFGFVGMVYSLMMK